MKKISLLVLIAIICLPLVLLAQSGSISGRIISNDQPVAFATISIPSIQKGTIADEEGHFSITQLPAGLIKLRITSIGFAAYEEEVDLTKTLKKSLNIELIQLNSELDEVVITGTMKESYVRDSPIKVEVISKKFLQQSPTNNVVEAMQWVNGVQEQVNCGVCGTNEIRINGMEGPYTLVLIDGMPIVSALASVYGFNGIPSSLVEQIEIVKGPAGALYGTEAVGGVINIITQHPEEAKRFSVNGFYSSHKEANLDVSGKLKIGKKWNALVSGNVYNFQHRLDENQDNFTDVPLAQRISLFSRWSMNRKDNRKFSIAGRYLAENRFGGVMNWEKVNIGSNEVYGEHIKTRRTELIGSYQLPISATHIRLDFSANHHYQDSYYGDLHYEAEQSIFFNNLVWEASKGDHSFIAGGTLRLQKYDDNTPATVETDLQFIPGVFAQNEWTLNDKLSLLGGMRLDHHQNHGWVGAPRIAFKYQPSDWTTFRFNSGKGFRLVNLFTEDHAALTGSREVVIEESLEPEQSWNINLNLNHVFLMGKASSGTLDLDLFYTYFQNKITPDYDTDPNQIIYRNLENFAVVKGASLAVSQRFTFPMTLDLGMTYQDVYQINSLDDGTEVKIPQVFSPNWSGTFSLGYEWKDLGLTIMYTGNVIGPQFLPSYPAPFEQPEQSPWYTLQHIKVGKMMGKNMELYGGIKNMWNYTQPSPLIDPSNPFGENFDTAFAYGPLQTRRLFLGMRWEIQ